MNPLILRLIVLTVRHAVPWVVGKIKNRPLRKFAQEVWDLVRAAELIEGLDGADKKLWVLDRLYEGRIPSYQKIVDSLGKNDAAELLSKTINAAAQWPNGSENDPELMRLWDYVEDVLNGAGHYTLARDFDAALGGEDPIAQFEHVMRTPPTIESNPRDPVLGYRGDE